MNRTGSRGRGGEWLLQNRGSRKILARSRNLGGFCVVSNSRLAGAFSVSESQIFFPQGLGVSRILLSTLSIRILVWLIELVFILEKISRLVTKIYEHK